MSGAETRHPVRYAPSVTSRNYLRLRRAEYRAWSTGFTADGEFVDENTLHHGGMIFRRR